MALHKRKIIRDAFRARLLGQTAAEDRVFAMRTIPFRATEMPAIAVYAVGEDVDQASVQSAPRYLKRTVNIAIEAAVPGGAKPGGGALPPVDDQCDAIALQIETALHADDQQGQPDVIHDSWLVGTEMEVFHDADRPYGIVRLVYAALYETPAPDPEVTPLVDDFGTADIRYNQRGEQEQADEAHDTLEGLEE